jgi:hypothetical protein
MDGCENGWLQEKNNMAPDEELNERQEAPSRDDPASGIQYESQSSSSHRRQYGLGQTLGILKRDYTKSFI